MHTYLCICITCSRSYGNSDDSWQHLLDTFCSMPHCLLLNTFCSTPHARHLMLDTSGSTPLTRHLLLDTSYLDTSYLDTSYLDTSCSTGPYHHFLHIPSTYTLYKSLCLTLRESKSTLYHPVCTLQPTTISCSLSTNNRCRSITDKTSEWQNAKHS